MLQNYYKGWSEHISRETSMEKHLQALLKYDVSMWSWQIIYRSQRTTRISPGDSTVTAAAGGYVLTCILPSVFVAFKSFSEVGVFVCWKWGMLSKHRRATGSGIAPSMAERVNTVSTCVWWLSERRGITNTGSDRTSRPFWSSRGQGRRPN